MQQTDNGTIEVMDGAKRKLRGILDDFDCKARCIYVDYPVHTNVGDLLINLGTETFFSDYNVNIWRRFSIYDFPERINGWDDKIVFLMHGGGNFGDIWPEHQILREHILGRYPNNRTIFLPQTVYYSSPESEKIAGQKLARHRNLHVYARDLESFERLKRAGVNSISMMPDMAHSLYGTLTANGEAEHVAPMLLVRTDKEASQVPDYLHAEAGSSIDWGDMFPLHHKVLWRLSYEMIKRTGIHWPSQQSRIWYFSRNALIRDGVNTFSKSNEIITNRLHAVLLGLILGKRVTWFDNNYGKLSSYIASWLSKSPNLISVHRASSLVNSKTL